jgi:hypothetical protein
MKKTPQNKTKKNPKMLPPLDDLTYQNLPKELSPLEVINKKKDPEIDPLDLLNEKLDINMNALVEKTVTTKVIENKTFKNIVNANLTESINQKLQPGLKNIFTIIARIYLTIWIIFILYSLILFNRIDQMYSWWFRASLHSLIFFFSSLLIFFMGIWILKQKKWIIWLTIIGLMTSTIACLLSLIPSGNISFWIYENFWGNLFNVIITFILLIFLFKNKTMFDK